MIHTRKSVKDDDLWTRANLPCWGWTKVCLNLDGDLLSACVNEINKLEHSSAFQSIFKTIEESEDHPYQYKSTPDNFRYQTIETFPKLFCKKPFYPKLMEHIKIVLDTVYNNLKISDCRVLKSLKGCTQQQMHVDIVQPTFMCFGAIVALEEGTHIILKDKSSGGHQPVKRVSIAVGEMLLFRGDLLHAGSSYENSDNLRLYFKVLPKGKKFDSETQVDQVQTFLCWSDGKGCKKDNFESASKLSRHRFWCPSCHTKEEIKRRRKNLQIKNKKTNAKRNRKNRKNRTNRKKGRMVPL